MARKILVAVDEGEESAYALSWCLKNLMVSHHNSNSKDTLVLLYAKPPQAVYIAMDSTGKDTVEMMVEYGDPRDVICEVAEKLKVDFLVMGSHGYGLIRRAFIGSVSNHCAQKVKCPVLVVKKPKSNDAHH
ncbi:UNVERIFIED_CONTAM: hypothetical protein Sradi_2870400 [Sesamum radiatum]|uniref:UspA domain-containing protein n=1 Tax=Sesamum radiatum TaxID=300843 RepID=A0AAW2RZ63_SESRA